MKTLVNFTDYTTILNSLNTFALKAFYASSYFNKDSKEFYQFTFNQCELSSKYLIDLLVEYLNDHDQSLLADLQDRIRLREAHYQVARDLYNEDLSIEYDTYYEGDVFQDKYDLYYNEY